MLPLAQIIIFVQSFKHDRELYVEPIRQIANLSHFVIVTHGKWQFWITRVDRFLHNHR
jgi:hypothetical protein